MNKIISFLLLILCLPFLFILGIAILVLEQKSPLFIQKRIGKNKVVFKLIKIRTMKENKVTFIGSILRKTGIDEIPQLINILKGEMNFVGPRPLTQNDIERLGWESEFYFERWSVNPGLTGLAQLSPICHKKISIFYDLYYVKNRTLNLDFTILFMSFLVLIFGKQTVKNMISKRQNKKKSFSKK